VSSLIMKIQNDGERPYWISKSRYLRGRL